MGILRIENKEYDNLICKRLINEFALLDLALVGTVLLFVLLKINMLIISSFANMKTIS